MPSDSCYVFHIDKHWSQRADIYTVFYSNIFNSEFPQIESNKKSDSKDKKTQLFDEHRIRHDVTLSQCYLNRVREHHILPSYWQNVNISHLFYKYKELWYFEYMYSQRTIRDFLTYWMLNDHSWGFLDIECTCMMVFNLHFKSIQNTTIKN